MKKFFTLLLIVLIAFILGVIYRVLHVQINYSISEEYYTKFLFFQFSLNYSWELNFGNIEINMPKLIENQPRLGVSIIGFLEFWWVGLIGGLVLGLIGLIHPTWKQMLRISIKAMVLTTSIAFAFGLLGIGLGYILQLLTPHENWKYSFSTFIENAFAWIGFKPDFAYIFVLIGLVFGIRYSIKRKKALKI